MNSDEFNIHDWQFKFRNSMILSENTDEILYVVQQAQEKGRINNDTVALIKQWLEHGGEESHGAIMDFLNTSLDEVNIKSTDALNIPPPEAAFSKAPYGDEIKSQEDLDKTELENN